MAVVAVTGVSGPLAPSVLRALGDDPSVERVIALPAHDLAAAKLTEVLRGVDTIVLLVPPLAPPRAKRSPVPPCTSDTRRLLDAAGSASVEALVCLSTAMVYGAWPGNPVPLTEDAPVRPNSGLGYAVQLAETERLASEWRDSHRGSRVVTLRPATVVGPGVDNWVARAAGEPTGVGSAAPPPMQYLHVDDLASALVLGVNAGLDGVFNVAPDGWVSGEEAQALASGTRLPLRLPVPAPLARLVGASASLPDAIPWLVHPWVVANDRIRAAGWQPTYSNEEALVMGSDPAGRSGRSWPRLMAAIGGSLAVGAVGAGAAEATRRLSRRWRGVPKG